MRPGCSHISRLFTPRQPRTTSGSHGCPPFRTPQPTRASPGGAPAPRGECHRPLARTSGATTPAWPPAPMDGPEAARVLVRTSLCGARWPAATVIGSRGGLPVHVATRGDAWRRVHGHADASRATSAASPTSSDHGHGLERAIGCTVQRRNQSSCTGARAGRPGHGETWLLRPPEGDPRGWPPGILRDGR